MGEPGGEELVVALLTGALELPLTDQVPLPDVVRWVGAGAVY